MASGGLMQRIDDALNPIMVKELRQAVQSKFVVAVLLLFLIMQILYLGIYLTVVAAEGRIESIEFQAGHDAFTALQIILLGTSMLFLPLYTGARLAAERNEVNTDLLFITTLKPRAIISGKIVSAVVLALLIFSSCAPFMLFTFFLRGVDWPSILFILTVDFLVVIASVQVTVFLAVVPANRIFKSLLGLVGLWALVSIFSLTVSGTLELLRSGITPMLDSWEFWLGSTAVACAVLGVGGLLFTWSVALISAPSSNRALPVRVYMILFWLVSGAALMGYSIAIREAIPFMLWFCAMSVLWALSLVIAINERRHWTVRVRRSIPRTWLFRLPAFLLFSGAAGGVLYACALMGLTVLTFFLFRAYGQDHGWFAISGWRTDVYQTMFNTMGVLALYAYAYAMTAVLARDWLFRALPESFTWIVMILLVAFGSLVPFLTSVLISYRRWNYNTHFYALLGNPGSAMMEFSEPRRYSHQEEFLLFVATWAGLVTVLTIPWLFQQWREFRPYMEDETV